MFDAVRNNKKIVQVFLVLIALPFAFFGVESYVNSTGTDGEIATIGDTKIRRDEFQNAMREQLDRMRAQLGQADPKLLDNPEIRRAILDDLINQRLLLIEARKQRLMASDLAVRQAIGAIGAFQQDGKFSNERYESLLRAQGMTPQGFEQQMRQDLTLQQLAGTIGRTALLPRTAADRIVALQTEIREVQEVRLALDDFLQKVKLEEGAIRKFYDDNATRFQIPEQARVEYLTLNIEKLPVTVSEEEIKSWYDGHKERYQRTEERRASHILIASERLGKDKARAKAEEVLAEVRKAPQAFAELAKKYSDDPGSASQGGDLGFFGRGMMVKPFEDAAFSLKSGETSGIVESDFGYHIIRLTGVHAAQVKPLAEVRGEIEAELKQSAAARKFAEAAEAFTNIVYEQADSLKPAADQFKLKVEQSGWLNRQADPARGALGNAKLLEAIFSDDAVKNKRNTEAVEVASNTLVAARVIEYKPATVRAFDEVKADIETLLKRQEAQKLATQAGEEKLKALRGGEDKLSWSAGKRVTRIDTRQVPPLAVRPIFAIDAAKLPGYAGIEVPGAGYALYRLSKVDGNAKMPDAERQAMLEQLTTLIAQEDMQNYLAALRTRYKVKVDTKALEASGER